MFFRGNVDTFYSFLDADGSPPLPHHTSRMRVNHFRQSSRDRNISQVYPKFGGDVVVLPPRVGYKRLGKAAPDLDRD